jgi:hypothetical protein
MRSRLRGWAGLSGSHAYPRGPDRRPILEMLMVSIDISAVQFE